MILGRKTINLYFLICTLFLIIATSCKKNPDLTKKEATEDPRMNYVGQWNFKANGYTFSGYYIYTPNAVWTYTASSTTDYNDSTGIIRLGDSPNELIIKYCSSCSPVIYDLNENGQGSWTLSDTIFFNDITPAPPSYSSSYSTYNIEGWKL